MLNIIDRAHLLKLLKPRCKVKSSKIYQYITLEFLWLSALMNTEV